MKIRYILILLLFSLVSCGNENKPDDIKEETIPPSMREQNESISIINLDSNAVENLKVEHFTASVEIADYEFVVPAKVFPAPENINVISAPISGRVSKIFKHEGDIVKKGDPLLEIESIEYTNLVFEYLQAKNEINIKTAQKDRLQRLLEQNINSKKEFEIAEYEFKTALNNLNASYSRLIAIGLSKNEIDNFTDGKTNSSFIIHAKISGKINEHLIDIGNSVMMYDKLLTIIDADKVMISGYISPEDAEFINEKDEVTIYTLKDNPANGIPAKIHSINPALDEINKAVVANIITKSLNGFPKPGQTIRVKIKSNSEKKMIVIPSQGLLYEDSDAFVFVKKSESQYIKTPVKIGFEADNKVYIAKGINEGDIIAISQIFTLKALSKFDEFAE